MAENMSQDLDSYLPEILLENSIGHLEEMNHLWSPRRSCPVSEAMLRPAPPEGGTCSSASAGPPGPEDAEQDVGKEVCQAGWGVCLCRFLPVYFQEDLRQREGIKQCKNKTIGKRTQMKAQRMF